MHSSSDFFSRSRRFAPRSLHFRKMPIHWMLPAYLFRGWKSASGSLYWRFFLVGVDLPLRVSRRLFFLQDLITITVALVTFGQHNLTSVTQLMRSVFISGQLSHASCPPLKDKTRNFNHRISKIYKSNLYHFWRKNSDQDISEDFLVTQHCELFEFSRQIVPKMSINIFTILEDFLTLWL